MTELAAFAAGALLAWSVRSAMERAVTAIAIRAMTAAIGKDDIRNRIKELGNNDHD